MHDPMVVAFEVPSPWPHRRRWNEKRDAATLGNWGLHRRRRVNPENLGEPIYPWWRPTGWTLRLAGRTYGLGTIATVWHIEPGGRDAFTVCKHASRWRWHVWHWKIQVHWLQRLRRFLFERCIECGHRFPWGYSPVAGRATPKGWARFRVNRVNFHHECASMAGLLRGRANDEQLIRHLVRALRAERGGFEADTLARLVDPPTTTLDFMLARRLWQVMGYERDDSYALVKKEE